MMSRLLSMCMMAAAFSVGAGCSSSNGGGSGGSGGSGGEGGAAPLIPPCADGTVLAIDHIYFGDTDLNGMPNPNVGWTQYGRNIDNLISTKLSTDLCKPTSGGSQAAIYPDGIDGIDNSFGKNVLPIFLGLTADCTIATNASIENGDFSYLITIRGPNEPMSCPASALFGGRTLGSIPKLDGSDQWPLDPAYFTDPTDPSSVKTVFPGVTMTNDVYDSASDAQFTLEMHFSGNAFYLPIQHTRFQMTLESGQTGAIAGHISGIIDPEDLTNEVARIAGIFDSSFCDPNSPTLQSVLNQLRQASDIMIDGTQDPTKECNGISIGLGFTMKSAKLGAIGPALAPPADPCTP